MAVNGIELAVGQRWRTRGGEEARVMRRTSISDDLANGYVWMVQVGTSQQAFTDEGRYNVIYGEHGWDLVELLSVGSWMNDRPDLTPTGPWPFPEPARAEIEPGSIVMVEGDVDITGVDFNPGTAINPKDAIGSTKLPLHLWPAEATAMGCLGMLEGVEKYGRNNYIAGNGVIASIYVDAAKRHIDAWFAGEDESPDSESPHLANALACLAIIVKAQAHNRLIDDRDYSPERGGSAYRRLVDRLTPYVGKIKAKFADKNPKQFTIKDIPQ